MMLKVFTRSTQNDFHELKRRLGWLLHGLTLGKILNAGVAFCEYALRRKRMHALPIVVKIDISPLCNLRCTVCVHAHPDGDPVLEQIKFDRSMILPLEKYREIIDQIRGKTMAVSLFWFGDPLMHPDLESMCRYACNAGLNVHINTNFSFDLSDERIESLMTCGISHFTVCIDGLTDDTYAKTRVGGRINLVKSNLERLCAYKKRMKLKTPIIEAQYIKFPHNVHQLSKARAWLSEIGVDRMVDFWGNLHNYTADRPDNVRVTGPRGFSFLPLCHWMYMFMVINFNGDVYPCCRWRVDEPFRTDTRRNAHVMGNVFETNVREVWNNRQYRKAREMSSKTAHIVSKEEYDSHFCTSCPNLFETDWRNNHRMAPDWIFDDIFEMTENRPVRRPENEAVKRRKQRLLSQAANKKN